MFTLNKKAYEYCTLNQARWDQRAVEVPPALALLHGHEKETLEIGRMLPFYMDSDPHHTIVNDRRETLYEDIIAYAPERLFKRVLCVSILNYIGSRSHFEETIDHLKSLVARRGVLWVSLSAHQTASPWLTPSVLRASNMKVYRLDKVHMARHEWREVVPFNITPARMYGWPTPFANTVYFLEWRAP